MTNEELRTMGRAVAGVLEDLAERLNDRASDEEGEVFRALDLVALSVQRTAEDIRTKTYEEEK